VRLNSGKSRWTAGEGFKIPSARQETSIAGGGSVPREGKERERFSLWPNTTKSLVHACRTRWAGRLKYHQAAGPKPSLYLVSLKCGSGGERCRTRLQSRTRPQSQVRGFGDYQKCSPNSDDSTQTGEDICKREFSACGNRVEVEQFGNRQSDRLHL
jgi:hypothetical protein